MCLRTPFQLITLQPQLHQKLFYSCLQTYTCPLGNCQALSDTAQILWFSVIGSGLITLSTICLVSNLWMATEAVAAQVHIQTSPQSIEAAMKVANALALDPNHRTTCTCQALHEQQQFFL